MMLQQRPDRKNPLRAAFTLMEVLVVVAILVILAGIGVAVFRYLDESKEKIAKLGIKGIEDAAMTYKINHGDFPPDLQVLTQPSEGKEAYLEEDKLIDPWGRPYKYDPSQRNRTGKPLIYSEGVNPGTSPQIRNWVKQ